MNTVLGFLTSPAVAMFLSVLLVVVILLQRSGKDLDGAFGGSGGMDSEISYERRGIEGTFYHLTVVLAFALLGVLIIGVLIQ